jgi:hypothetical protein
MRLSNFYPPGFTQQCYIAAVPRLHDELRFAFQPATVLERAELQAAFADGPAHGLQRAAAIVAAKLLSWDLHAAGGPVVPIAVENLLAMQGEAFEKLYKIVFGILPSDLDPTWPAERVAEEIADQRAAEAAGLSIGELREERDEKNSSRG